MPSKYRWAGVRTGQSPTARRETAPIIRSRVIVLSTGAQYRWFHGACHRKVLTELVNQYNPCIERSQLLGWWPRTVRAPARSLATALTAPGNISPTAPARSARGHRKTRSARLPSTHSRCSRVPRCALPSLCSVQCLRRPPSPSARPLSTHPDESHTPPQPIALLVGRFAHSCDAHPSRRDRAQRRGRTRLAVGRERVPSECEAAQPGEGQAWVGPWRMKGEDRWRSYSRLSRHYSSEARISCSATANDPRASSLVCESNRSADLIK